MFVMATAHVRNEDMRRLLNKAECEPGDIFDLPDGLAEVYLKEGWVIPANKPEGKPLETAAHSGAPERAVTRRGGLTKSSLAPKVKDG